MFTLWQQFLNRDIITNSTQLASSKLSRSEEAARLTYVVPPLSRARIPWPWFAALPAPQLPHFQLKVCHAKELEKFICEEDLWKLFRRHIRVLLLHFHSVPRARTVILIK